MTRDDRHHPNAECAHHWKETGQRGSQIEYTCTMCEEQVYRARGQRPR
jgi:hypothetical protein